MSSIALASLILALVTPAMTAGAEPPKLEWTLVNPPGIQIILEETKRTPKPGRSEVCYLLRAEGLPREEAYWLYMHWMDGEMFAMPFGFKLDDQGILYKDNPRDFNDLCTHGMLRGEPMGFALVSQESGIKAFGEVVPFPIEAVGEGECRISLELIPSKRGDTFTLRASGFVPGEEAEVVSRSGREVLSSKENVSDEGTFMHVVVAGVRGRKGGEASITVTGKSCTVSLAYDWGRDMKIQ